MRKRIRGVDAHEGQIALAGSKRNEKWSARPPEIEAQILAFVQSQSLALGQIDGCHRFYEAEERLARWLLMAQDRASLTFSTSPKRFLGVMPEVRRTTVTIANYNAMQAVDAYLR